MASKSGAAAEAAPKIVRCAIYTRKSTDEGLDQAFNSLDAQREAAEAFIASQRHQGWVASAERFDDGGYTGANMDRPGLKRLLEAIEHGEVDCVVVYKVDRLSRSLLDFARIMQVFEQRNASFVSITQHFNTTVSIGRLTLNILLSFAQFERELISERTRDKLAAARRKGKWVGGAPPLGYDVAAEGGRLVVNSAEAQTIQELFSTYLRCHNVAMVAAELNSRGLRTKQWTSRKGRLHAGGAFTKNAVTTILGNYTYAGQVSYRGEIYSGEHAAIIDEETWEATCRLRQAKEPRRRSESSPEYPLTEYPLNGRLVCSACLLPMVGTYTLRLGRQHRYYVCQRVQRNGWKSCPTRSVNAGLIEAAVAAARVRRANGRDGEGPIVRVIYERAQHRARIEFGEGGETVDVPVVRFGHREKRTRTPRIAKLMALAIRSEELLRQGVAKSYTDLARLGIVSRQRVTQIMNLLNLAPDIQEEILCIPTVENGTEPISERAVRRIPLMPCWNAQRRAWRQLQQKT